MLITHNIPYFPRLHHLTNLTFVTKKKKVTLCRNMQSCLTTTVFLDIRHKTRQVLFAPLGSQPHTQILSFLLRNAYLFPYKYQVTASAVFGHIIAEAFKTYTFRKRSLQTYTFMQNATCVCKLLHLFLSQRNRV